MSDVLEGKQFLDSLGEPRSGVAKQIQSGKPAMKSSAAFLVRLKNSMIGRDRPAPEPLFFEKPVESVVEPSQAPKIETLSEFGGFAASESNVAQNGKGCVQSGVSSDASLKKRVCLELGFCDADSIYWVFEALNALCDQFEREGKFKLVRFEVMPEMAEAERVCAPLGAEQANHEVDENGTKEV